MFPVWVWVIGGLFILGLLTGGPAKESPEDKAERVAQQKEEEAERKKERLREAQEAKVKAKAEAKLKAEEANRGPKPVPSAWDGLTPEVRAYFDESLKDPDSLQIAETYEVMTFGETGWMQRVKYRAKNSFGGYELEDQVFVIVDGKVVHALDYEKTK